MSATFTQHYMLEAVQEKQPYFLSCVFSIIRAWHAQGKPRTNDARHDFREWAQVCDWIVQNIFGEAPLMDGHAEAQQRVSSPDYTFLRGVAVAVAARNRLGEELKARDIFELCEETQLLIPGLTPEKRHDEDASNKVIGKIMARLFGEGDVVTVDAFEVQHVKEDLGFIPSMQDWFKHIHPQVWMGRTPKLVVDEAMPSRSPLSLPLPDDEGQEN